MSSNIRACFANRLSMKERSFTTSLRKANLGTCDLPKHHATQHTLEVGQSTSNNGQAPDSDFSPTHVLPAVYTSSCFHAGSLFTFGPRFLFRHIELQALRSLLVLGVNRLQWTVEEHALRSVRAVVLQPILLLHCLIHGVNDSRESSLQKRTPPAFACLLVVLVNFHWAAE